MNKRTAFKLFLGCVMYCLLGTGIIQANTPHTESQINYFRGSKLYTGGHLESWSLSNDSNHVRVTQLALPIMYSIDLNQWQPGLALDVVTTPLTGIISGSSTSIPKKNGTFGLSGTKLRGSYHYQDLVLATLGFQVPTGTNKLSPAESSLDQALGTRQMHFRVGSLGSGWNTHATISTAREIADDLILGASLGILAYGPYEPIESDPLGGKTNWNSGNEYSLAAGLDYIIYQGHLKFKILSDLVYTYYTTDKLNGSEVFQAGPKWDLNSTVGTKINSEFYYTGNIRIIYRQKYRLPNGDFTTTPFSDAYRKTGMDYFLANYLQLLEIEDYHPFVLFRLYKFGGRESPDGTKQFGNTLTAGIGGGGKLSLSPTLDVNAKSIIDLGGLSGTFLNGIEISGGARFSF